MSKKIRKPSKPVAPLQAAPAPQPQVPPLGADADSLVTEWRRLQGLLLQVNQGIREEQKKMQDADTAIKNLQNQGNQLLGSSASVSRILTGMGVNPENHTVSEPSVEVVPPALVPVEDDVEEDYPAESPVVTGNFHSEALRRRFNK